MESFGPVFGCVLRGVGSELQWARSRLHNVNVQRPTSRHHISTRRIVLPVRTYLYTYTPAGPFCAYSANVCLRGLKERHRDAELTCDLVIWVLAYTTPTMQMGCRGARWRWFIRGIGINASPSHLPQSTPYYTLQPSCQGLFSSHRRRNINIIPPLLLP